MKYKLIRHNELIVSSCEDTRKYLTVGEVYEVDRIEVRSWHTRLYIDGRPFNSICFEKVIES